jgi:hypothetical protein
VKLTEAQTFDQLRRAHRRIWRQWVRDWHHQHKEHLASLNAGRAALEQGGEK